MQLSKCDWWPSLFLRLSIPGVSPCVRDRMRDKCPRKNKGKTHSDSTDSLWGRGRKKDGKKKKHFHGRNVLLVRSILPSSITRPRVYLVICRETRDSGKASHAVRTINLCPANQPCPRDRSSSPVERLRARADADVRCKRKDGGNTFADVKRRAAGQAWAPSDARTRFATCSHADRRTPASRVVLVYAE